MSNYVLVHGAWHTGAELEPIAAHMRAAGHDVHTPTLAGNRPGDAKTSGLEDDIRSIVDYLDEHDLSDVNLLGHSYAGMVITGVADRAPERLRRLIYWNAFVPNDGEALVDMAPAEHAGAFEAIAAERGDGSVMLPFPLWRDVFINDVDSETATRTYQLLNPHPYKTVTDRISLRKNPAQMTLAKSYINCTDDLTMPPELPWHPRLSDKLGLYRLVQVAGSHELCFSDPARAAGAIMDAARD